jgi:hypothetical protein
MGVGGHVILRGIIVVKPIRSAIIRIIRDGTLAQITRPVTSAVLCFTREDRGEGTLSKSTSDDRAMGREDDWPRTRVVVERGEGG